MVMVDIGYMAGGGEIAQRLNMKPSTFNTWAARGDILPQPILMLARGPIWDYREVIRQIPSNNPDTATVEYLNTLATGRETETDELAGVTELGRILHLQPSTVGGWYDRRHSTHFPEAVIHLRTGRCWNIGEVVDWYKNWTPKRNVPKVGHL